MVADKIKRERPPFTIIEDAILEDKRISKHGLLVYWVLCRHSDKQAHCFPSIRRIGKQTRLGVATVWRAIEELVDTGYIERRKRQVPGREEKTSNLYTILYRCSREEHRVPRGIHPCSRGMKELDPSELDPMNKKDIAAQEAAVVLPAKSPHGRIRLLFEKLHGQQFSNYGKEGKAIKQLINLVARLYPDKDPETVISFMARCLKHLKDTRREPYWQEISITPSILLSRWEQVFEIAKSKHKNENDWKTMKGAFA